LIPASVPKGVGALLYQQPACWPLLADQRSMLLGLEDAGGYNPVQLPRYWKLIRAVDRVAIRYNAAFLEPVTPQARALLQVNWIVESTSGGRFTSARLAPPIPRASVYTSWRTVTGPNAALRAVTSASLPTLERTAVLETRPS